MSRCVDRYWYRAFASDTLQCYTEGFDREETVFGHISIEPRHKAGKANDENIENKNVPHSYEEVATHRKEMKHRISVGNPTRLGGRDSRRDKTG